MMKDRLAEITRLVEQYSLAVTGIAKHVRGEMEQLREMLHVVEHGRQGPFEPSANVFTLNGVTFALKPADRFKYEVRITNKEDARIGDVTFKDGFFLVSDKTADRVLAINAKEGVKDWDLLSIIVEHL